MSEFAPAPHWVHGEIELEPGVFIGTSYPETCQPCDTPELCADEHDCTRGLDVG